MKKVVIISVRFIWRRIVLPAIRCLPPFRQMQLHTLAHHLKMVLLHGLVIDFDAFGHARLLDGEVFTGIVIPQLHLGTPYDEVHPTPPSNDLIPAWAISELCQIAEIEPDLFPTPEFLNQFISYTPPLELEPGRVYSQCCSIIGDNKPDIILLVPWLKRGGADLGALHHINAALSIGKSVLVIATLDEDSPWKDRIPAEVEFIELGRIGCHLSESHRLAILTRLVLQSSAVVIHIINSQLGWEMVKRHGKSLVAVRKRIYASVYSDGFDENGVVWSYPRFYLIDCWRYLDGLLCDSTWYPKELKRQFGISMNKIYTVYFPVSIQKVLRYHSGSSRRVLWAGRVTRSKRPDLLIDIARALLDVTFDVFGYAETGPEKEYENKLRELPNVYLHGGYDHFSSLVKADKYALFLYTSAWDGLPNVLLEATSYGLPIVASAICGIPELINEDTGYPVENFEDSRAYVTRILEAFEDETGRRRRWENAIRLVQSRHSESEFANSLRSVDGYFDHSANT